MISVITVVFNDVKGLERTIESVISQTFHSIEFIIIDGGSTDGTLDVIKKYEKYISKWISEPDRGIYDAMNKGVRISTGDWLIMMNAGDVFADKYVVEKVFSYRIPDTINIVYGDKYTRNKKGELILSEMSIEKGKMNQQTVFYRKTLHEEHGLYIVTPQIIISDYLFYYRIPKEQYLKINIPIVIFDGGGISSKGMWALYQIASADVVFRRRSFYNAVRYVTSKLIKSIIPADTKANIKKIVRIM